MTKLIYPTVSLFLYDLRDGIGQDSDEIYVNQINFWRKSKPEIDRAYKKIQKIDQKSPKDKSQLPEKITQEVAALNKEIKDHAQEFLDKEEFETEVKKLDYYSFKKQEDYLYGMYFALQSGDIYALQIEASDGTSQNDPAERNDAPRPLEQLARLKKLVISKINHHQSAKLDPDKLATLGQTWLVWGKATDQKTTNEQLRELAKECFSQLEPGEDWKPDFKEVGELIGAKVFEYSHTPKKWFSHPPKEWLNDPKRYEKELEQFSGEELEEFRRENYHIVLLLFPANDISTDKIRKNVTDITVDLIKLFAYRHKIIWSYRKSRRFKAQLKEDSQAISKLKKQINNFQRETFNLTNLEESLKKSWLLLAAYSTTLDKLNSQQHTIKINLSNYEKRLATIEKFFPEAVNSKVFHLFVTTANERYFQQVKMDHMSLSVELSTLKNLIQTIDTLVNIERTRAEKRLNNTIGFVGLGLAASSSIAGIMATQVYQPEQPKIEPSPKPQSTPTIASPTVQATTQPPYPPQNWILGHDRISWQSGLTYSLIVPVGIAVAIWLYFKKKR